MGGHAKVFKMGGDILNLYFQKIFQTGVRIMNQGKILDISV